MKTRSERERKREKIIDESALWTEIGKEVLGVSQIIIPITFCTLRKGPRVATSSAVFYYRITT